MPDEKTYGQKLVGLDFNHAEGQTHDVVHAVKLAFAELIDTVNDQRTPNDSHIKNTLSTFAVTSCLAAQMAVVKVLTWKD